MPTSQPRLSSRWIDTRLVCFLSISATQKAHWGISLGPQSRTPSNEEVYDFWANDPRGQALIKHLLSESQLASSRAATTSALDQLLHGIHDCPAPSDTFMDPCNAKEVDVSEIMDHRKPNPHVETHLAKAFILDLAFPAAHEDANLILAPKALDHLKEFERKRCAAVEAVSSMVGASTDEVKVYVALWLKTIPDKERQIDAWLSKLYVQLRSWVCNLPFQSPSCVLQ